MVGIEILDIMMELIRCGLIKVVDQPLQHALLSLDRYSMPLAMVIKPNVCRFSVEVIHFEGTMNYRPTLIPVCTVSADKQKRPWSN